MVITITPSRLRNFQPRAARVSTRLTTATTNSITTCRKLNVAADIEDAITSMIKPISSGSLIGVRNRMMDRAPSNPSESGMESCTPMNSVVIEMPNSGKERCTWLPVPRLS
jgi:hypothetical protein